jgi:predicted RNase H-like HicB family nuclease/predicted RNA binding protein YcfA (HicA-like mRNA interferase family)
MADQGNEEEIDALVHPSDGGGFWAEVIGLPGCYTQGDNYSQILTNLRDAHALCSSSETHSDATPHPTNIALQEGCTVADLIGVLTTAGWVETGENSSTHALYSHPQANAKLCLPRDPNLPLKPGFNLAITKFLSG